ncbi:hypothetical protein RBH85_11220 [Streptomyces rochei]|nr:hypothetical protein [Streptomyces rochei]WMI57295.1 hypothetical protein RBH85_11220 [Streptomyces rochei]
MANRGVRQVVASCVSRDSVKVVTLIAFDFVADESANAQQNSYV